MSLRVRVLVVLSIVVLPVIALAAAEVTLVSDDARAVVFDVAVRAYDAHPVVIDGREYVELTLPGEALTLDAGAPALPYVARSVIVPDGADLAVDAEPSLCRELRLAVAPSKGNLSRAIDPARVAYTFGAAYHSGGLAPAAPVVLGNPYVMRDRRGVAVHVFPFRYDAVRETLQFCERVRVSVSFANAAPARSAAALHPARAFDELYAAHFLNAAAHRDASRYPRPDDQGEMLVIAHDPWIPNLGAFVTHKQGIGIPTTVVGVSTIGNTAAAIKSYIQNYYNAHDLAFVLLVGDADQVATSIRVVGGENGASDAYYSKLAGGDNYPDVLVGRFSAATVADVDTQVLRSVAYEDNAAPASDWFKRGVGIASDQGQGQGDEGQSDHDHIEQIRGWLLGDGYTQVDQVYDPGATAQMVSDGLNAGRGVVNYCGHGSPTSWGTTGFSNANVDALVNKDKLPFIFSVACNNGEFHHYAACFAEAWLRASKDGRPTGAVAMYASSVSQSWAPPMEAEDEFDLRLTDATRPYHAIGALYYAGSSSMMDAYGSGGVDMFDTWVIFGDPSLRVVGTVKPPSGLSIEPATGLAAAGPLAGPFTPGEVQYTLTNLDATPLDFAVTTSEAWIAASPAGGALAPGATVTVHVTLGGAAANFDFGTHAGSVQFANLTTHDGDAARPVSVDVGSSTTVRRWACDADPGWTRAGEWQFGQPTGQGGGYVFHPDPAAGCTGSKVYGVNLAGNIANRLGGPYWLTTAPIDLTGVHGATLRFSRWLNTAGPPYVDSGIEASRDGVTWTRVWTAGKEVTDAQWTDVAVDVSAVVDDAPAARFRWGYAVLKALSTLGSGWNVDDVAVAGRLATARIALSVARDRLAWTPLAGVSGYDVVRGDAAVLASGGGNFTAATAACLADGLAAAELAAPDVPAAGGAWWYLVRGATASEPLTWQDLAAGQEGTRDAEIAASANACP